MKPKFTRLLLKAVFGEYTCVVEKAQDEHAYLILFTGDYPDNCDSNAIAEFEDPAEALRRCNALANGLITEQEAFDERTAIPDVFVCALLFFHEVDGVLKFWVNTRHKDPDKHISCCGGKVEEGETWEQSLYREVEEEAGLTFRPEVVPDLVDLDPKRLRWSKQYDRPGWKQQSYRVQYFFYRLNLMTQPLNCEPEKHTPWVSHSLLELEKMHCLPFLRDACRATIINQIFPGTRI